MEDRDWLIIKMLYDNKNITKTAQALFTAQPALTARIRQIEDDLGVKMICRSNRGIHFTPEGEYLAQCAENILAEFRRIRDHVANLGNDVKGTLQIGASNYVTRYILPRLLKTFKDTYPNVEFKVVTALSRDIIRLVQNQELHVGFIRGDYSWSGEKHLLFDEAICVASKNVISLDTLPALARIDYRTDDFNRALLTKWWRDNFLQPPLISISVNQVDACKDMLLNGLGYAILPSRILNDVSDIHTIVITDKEGNPIVRKTWLIYQSESAKVKLVNVFVDFVKTTDFCIL